MRRLVVMTALAVVLTGISACADTADTATAPSASAPAPSPSHNTAEVCATFEALFDGPGLEKFSIAIAEMMIARSTGKAATIKAAEEKVTVELKAFSAELAKAGASATDPELKADFEAAVAAVDNTAADPAFLRGLNSPDDLEAKLTPELTSWALPLTASCSLS